MKSGPIHHRRTGSFHGELKRATLKRRGIKLVQGKGEPKRGRCGMEGDAVRARQ